MGLKYTKISGTGNTFVLIDLSLKKDQLKLNQLFKNKKREEISQVLCKKFDSDGLFFLLNPSMNSSLDFEADFYNKDGSRAEMCGNGAASLAYFAYKKNSKKKKKFSFKFLLSDLIQAKVIKDPLFSFELLQSKRKKIKTNKFEEKNKIEEKNQHKKDEAFIELKCFQIQIIGWDKKIQVFKKDLNYHLIHSGVPHMVIEYPYSWNKKDLFKISKFLRKNKKFSKEKVNITYFKQLDKKIIKAISFERGVENFTKACGTGALASAFCHYKKNLSHFITFVHMPGGLLKVDFKSKKPLLTSQVKILKEGLL